MIGVIDYGAGNLHSVRKALDFLELPNAIVGAPEKFSACDRLLLPGVGHFASAMDHLRATGLLPALRDWLRADRSFLGICLGMQLLFAGSEEAPGVKGLAFFAGMVRRFQCRPRLQIGWNSVRSNRTTDIWPCGHDEHFYFVNGYFAEPAERTIVAGVSDHGAEFVAAVQWGRVWGVQFHPEKSAAAGLELLRRWGHS